MVVLDSCSRILGRLRCLGDCAEALDKGQPFPDCICYVPDQIIYKPKKSFALSVYARPDKTSKKTEVLCTSKHRVFLSATQEKRNQEGQWIILKKVLEADVPVKLDPESEWIIFSNSDLIQEKSSDPDSVNCWKDVIDFSYSLNPGLKKEKRVLPLDEDAVAKLRNIPYGWSLKHDQALIKQLSTEIPKWTVKDFVDSVEASENNSNIGVILDEEREGEWYAYDGRSHIILKMKKNTVIRALSICFDGRASREGYNRPPSEIRVFGGEKGSEELLNTYKTDASSWVNDSMTVLSGEAKHYPSLKIEFVGSETIVTGIRFEGLIDGFEEQEFIRKTICMPNFFEKEPLIAPYQPDFLYWRTLLLQRAASLLDDVLMYMLPVWSYSMRSFDRLKHLQILMPLSSKQKNLVKSVLETTVSSTTREEPLLYIQRNFLKTTKVNMKDTVFYQIYDGMMKKEADREMSVSSSYRVAKNSSQWWKCIFIGEGIVDQGGGFRDTLSDIAEELCPSEAGCELVLPFFIPCANQQNGVASNYRDAYIPNPSCLDFQKYEWIGMLMGACLRTNESLAFFLSPFFWKMLEERDVTWLDYMSVDEAQVMSLNEIEKMDEETYAAYFTEMRTWTVVLSDGTSVPLKPNGDQLYVPYAERLEYVRLAKEAQMNESKLQVAAIRRGLLMVVPEVILWLLTPDELELNICGNPEVLFDDLKKYVVIRDSSLQGSNTLKYFWKVLENFSSSERSRFLRFATGRRRLPTHVFVNSVCEQDRLPSASTCGHHFYLPKYSSLQKAEELIRMAIYSCKFIDADTAYVD